MTIQTWPSDLPDVALISGFSTSLSDGRLMTAPDAGPPKIRRRSSAAVQPITFAFHVDLNGYRRFKRFWDEDTSGGAEWFLLPDRTMDGRALCNEIDVTIVNESDETIVIDAWWLAVFATPPAIVPIHGDLFRIEMNLSLLKEG